MSWAIVIDTVSLYKSLIVKFKYNTNNFSGISSYCSHLFTIMFFIYLSFTFITFTFTLCFIQKMKSDMLWSLLGNTTLDRLDSYIKWTLCVLSCIVSCWTNRIHFDTLSYVNTLERHLKYQHALCPSAVPRFARRISWYRVLLTPCKSW